MHLERVETQFLTLGDPTDPFVFESGETLASVTLAYEIYGKLNEAGDNAILLFHALTGSHHAAGYNPSIEGVGSLWTEEMHVGWWEDFIGPSRALNTDKFAVICVNYVGHCYGSTGPRDIDPSTGVPYGGSFPEVSVGDIVNSQLALLDHLGIGRLHAAIGGSTGGMMALHLAALHPGRVRYVVPIASALKASPLHIIHNFEQINAIMDDPNFQGGDYYATDPPEAGLALARMIVHKTFVSLQAMQDRARDEVLVGSDPRVRLPLQSYMWHQGQKFVKRFDANAYLRTMWMWQHFDLYADARAAGVSISELLASDSDHEYLLFSIDSDVCFYPEDQHDLVEALKAGGVPARRVTVHSDKGHDSFLLDVDLFSPHLRHLLEQDWDPARSLVRSKTHEAEVR